MLGRFKTMQLSVELVAEREGIRAFMSVQHVAETNQKVVIDFTRVWSRAL